MKSSANILNLLRDLGKRTSLKLFPLILFFYVLGIVFWYQYNHPFFLIIGLFILPLKLLLKRTPLFFVICIFFFSLGAIRASYSTSSENREILGYGKIISFPRISDYYKEVIIQIKSSSIPLKSFSTIRFDRETNIQPFDYIYFIGTVKKRLHYRNDTDYPFFYENFLSNRYFIKANFIEKIYGNTLINNLSEIREKVKNRFLNTTNSAKYFFVEVLFGEKMLDDKTRDIFNKSGTAHLLSISGLHFSLTVFFSYLLIYAYTFFFPNILLKIPRNLLIIFFAMPLLIIYTFLSGLSIPSTRAFIIFIAIFFFLLFKKNPNYLSLLCLIALIFLIFEPTYIFSVSFQLSFASVFALVILGEKLNKSITNKINKRFPKYLINIFLATISVNILILPIITNLQGKMFFSGFISNILAIPIFSFIILPFLFVSLPFSLFKTELFSLMLTIPETGFNILLLILEKINDLFSGFSLNLYFNFRISLIYYFFIFLVIYLPRYLKIIPFLLVSLFLINFNDVKDRNFSAVFLDVGQGESALVQSKNGNIVMIDCGGNIYDENIFNRAYAPFFRKHNINEIFAIIISHHHPDHTIALKELLKNIKVSNIFLTADAQSNLKDLFSKEQVITVNQHKRFYLDDLEIELIPPTTYDKKANNNSLWTVIKKGNKKFIFTGDTENKFIKPMLNKLSIDKTDVIYLKAPHHGSRYSFYPEMYRKLNPNKIIISAGIDNIWSLPSPEVINFLKENKITTFRTDIQGQITIKD